MASTAAAPRRTAVRRSGAEANASSKWASWASRPTVEGAPAVHLAPVGLVDAGHDPEQGRLAGPVRPDHAHPLADRDGRVDGVEDDERADLAGDVGEADQRHLRRPPARPRASGPARAAAPARRGSGSARGSGPAPAPVRARARRVAAACRVRSVRARASVRAASSGVRPSVPSPGSSTQRRPRARGARRGRQDRRGPRTVGGREPLAPRAEVGCPLRDHDAPDRPTAARAGLARALVRLQAFLHAAVSVGSRVVVDRGAAPGDGLGEHGPDLPVEARLVRRPQRRDGAQRVEPRPPERLVGVDVADPGDEPLVQQERLEAPTASAQPGAEGPHRERVLEGLGPDAVEEPRARPRRRGPRR